MEILWNLLTSFGAWWQPSADNVPATVRADSSCQDLTLHALPWGWSVLNFKLVAQGRQTIGITCINKVSKTSLHPACVLEGSFIKKKNKQKTSLEIWLMRLQHTSMAWPLPVKLYCALSQICSQNIKGHAKMCKASLFKGWLVSSSIIFLDQLGHEPEHKDAKYGIVRASASPLLFPLQVSNASEQPYAREVTCSPEDSPALKMTSIDGFTRQLLYILWERKGEAG